MSDVIKVKASVLFDLVEDILEKDGSAWITVTGMSMYPLLRGGADNVELVKTTFESTKRGDIVLIRRESGAYVLHRVLKKTADSFYIIGDAQQCKEGPLTSSNLIARVSKIKRNNIVIDSRNLFYKLYYNIWFLLIPFRSAIIKTWVKAKGFFRKFQRGT